MAWSPKDPHSSEFFALDFSTLLADGDSVASVVGLSPDVTDGMLVIGTPAQNANLVVCRFSAGTLGYTYQVRADVLTTQGEALSLTGVLLVRVVS